MTALPVEPQTMADVERAREAHRRLWGAIPAVQVPKMSRPRAVKGGLPIGRIYWEVPRLPRPEVAPAPAFDEAHITDAADVDSMDAPAPMHHDDIDDLHLIEADLVEGPEPSAEEVIDKKQDEHQRTDRRISIELVICTVAEYSGVTVRDLLSQRRPQNVVMPRQVVMFLAKDLTMFSLPSIGRLMAGRDHTTILHGVRKIERIMSIDELFAEKVEAIKAEILRRAVA